MFWSSGLSRLGLDSGEKTAPTPPPKLTDQRKIFAWNLPPGPLLNCLPNYRNLLELVRWARAESIHILVGYIPGRQPCLGASLMESHTLARMKLICLKGKSLKYFISIRQEAGYYSQGPCLFCRL